MSRSLVSQDSVSLVRVQSLMRDPIFHLASLRLPPETVTCTSALLTLLATSSPHRLTFLDPMFEQYPFDKDSKRIEIIPKEEDLSRIRARNALKILLDVHSDFANVKRSS